MMTTKLRITLYIIGTYQAVFGSMVVLAPGVFQRITQTTLSDQRVTLLYGSYLLIFAFVSFMAAREKEAASKLSLTVLLVAAANLLVFGSLLLTGRETFARVGPALLANVVLTPLIFFFRRQPRVVR
jgi:glucose-6-phosphate-specific signal transduction histidine kinase